MNPFKMCVGGPIGSGRQYMSWIHNEDEVGLILFATIQGIATLVTGGIVAPDELDALVGDAIAHFLRGSRTAA